MYMEHFEHAKKAIENTFGNSITGQLLSAGLAIVLLFVSSFDKVLNEPLTALATFDTVITFSTKVLLLFVAFFSLKNAINISKKNKTNNEPPAVS